MIPHPNDAAKAAPGSITPEDVDVIAALNYTAMTLLSAGAVQPAADLVDKTIEAFGPNVPSLICLYATRVVAGHLGPVDAEAALGEVFTAEEQAQPLIRLIRLSIVLTQQGKLPGYEGKAAEARAELDAFAQDPAHDASLRDRASELLRRSLPLDQAA